jgi:hypothetical protein
MKIDLKRLRKLENDYERCPICLGVIHACVNENLSISNAAWADTNTLNSITIGTLLDLKILVNDDQDETKNK